MMKPIFTLKKSKKSLVSSLLLSTLVLSFIGCSKKEEHTIALDVLADKTTSPANPQIIPVPNANTYPSHLIDGQMTFDWEHADQMPTAAGDIQIPTPWSDQASRHFSEDIRYDFKKSDGWELYHSTFTTSYLVGNRLFVLYNKYRGILRQYFYVEQGVTPVVKDFSILTNTLHIVGAHAAQSPLINFADQQIVDLDHHSEFVSSISPQPLTNATWYAVEYELAFDKEVYQQTHQTFNFLWPFGMIKPLSLAVNNNEMALNSEIRKQGFDFLGNGNVASEVNIILKGPSDIAKLAGALTPSDVTPLNKILVLQTDEQLLSGSSQSSGSSEVFWNAALTFTQDLSGVGIVAPVYNIGGANNSAQPGAGNFYTQALGVFYLNQKPVVKYTQSGSGAHPHRYELDETSLQYMFNPTVTNLANIENIHQEIVATKADDLLENFSRSKLYTGQTLSANLPMSVQGVRVSFDVVPKDGSAKVHIVKTFRATIK